MKLLINASLIYDFPAAAEVLLQLHVARGGDWRLVSEALDLTPGLAATARSHEAGKSVVFAAPAGRLALTYTATVEGEGRQASLAGQPAAAIAAMPAQVLPYQRPSAYCPANRFSTFVRSQFAGLEGGDKVLAIADWIRTNVAYQPGISTCDSTAMDTFTDRAGVCRDFAHLCVSLCRAADMPARVVSAYALGLDPPDFHAVAEVYVGGAWRKVDATGLVFEENIVPICHGRDAADVPFMTIFGNATRVDQVVSVVRED